MNIGAVRSPGTSNAMQYERCGLTLAKNPPRSSIGIPVANTI